MGEAHPFGEVAHPLEAEPEGLHSGLTVALAPEKAAETGDEPDYGVEGVRLLRWSLFGRDLRRLGLPLLGRRTAAPHRGPGKFSQDASVGRCASPRS